MEAMRLGKPVLLLRETDVAHGAIRLMEARAEVQELLLTDNERLACDDIVGKFEQGQFIEWYREAHLKHAALCAVIQSILATQQPSPLPELRVNVRADRQAAQIRKRVTRVYVSPNYAHLMAPSGQSFRDEVADVLGVLGVEVVGEAEEDVPFLLLLCPGVFMHAELAQELAALVGVSAPTSRGYRSFARGAVKKASISLRKARGSASFRRPSQS
eukprot:7378014-Prymnesium_polylepis.1